MRRSQLAINCPSPLLQRLRTAAKQRELRWFCAGRQQCLEVRLGEVVKTGARPWQQHTRRIQDQAALMAFTIDGDPAFAMGGDGMDLGFVGVEFHGVDGTGFRAKARLNCGQIEGWPGPQQH